MRFHGCRRQRFGRKIERMDSQNKESFWKQVFMRLHVTDDDRAIFPAGSVLPLDVTTARPLVGDEEVLVTKLLSEKFGKNVENSRLARWILLLWAALPFAMKIISSMPRSSASLKRWMNS